jgi:hypothetical protein
VAVIVRVAAALFCVTLGLSGGYVLWGKRVATLSSMLDRLTLEYDAVRARAGSGAGTSPQSLAVILESLNDQVREQGVTLAQQSDALSRVIGERDTQVSESQRSCDEIQSRIQQQLETCLFARAELERQAAAAKQAAAPLPPGRQTVTDTIEVPQVPGLIKKGSVPIRDYQSGAPPGLDLEAVKAKVPAQP